MRTSLDPINTWFALEKPYHSVVLSTRARLVRNLKGQNFPDRLRKESEDRLRSEAEAALRASSISPSAKLALGEISPLTARLAVERLLLSPARLQRKRGVLWLSENEECAALWGGEDHLCLSAIQMGFDLSAMARVVQGWEAELSNRLEFAALPDWGYISSRPRHSGSGLKLSLIVNLAGVTRTGMIDQVLRTVEKRGFALNALWTSEQGESDLYLLSGQFSCGLLAADQVVDLEDLTRVLSLFELEARRASVAHQRWEMEDLAGRAWGILTNARRLSWTELLFHLSALRQAEELAILKPIKRNLLDQMLFSLQSAQLQAAHPKRKVEEDVLRAEIVRHKLGEGVSHV